MRTYRGHKKDANHDTIAQAFKDHGASVIDTHALGDGFPDIVVGYRGFTALVEVKNGRNRLTDDERRARDNWLGGDWLIIRTVDEVDTTCAEIGRRKMLEELPF